jgi:signal transduction histidine kinase
VAASPAAGLRLQIVLALGGLMLLAFVPLFFAVASLTEATLRGLREQSSEALGRAVATHVADVPDAAKDHVGKDGVDAIAIFRGEEVSRTGEGADRLQRTAGRGEVAVTRNGATVVVRMHVPDVDGGSLVRLVALYMITFALALLVFAYFALTRLIVRPIETLARAADRVATGARALEVPRSGAREIAELGASVHAMTAKLMAEEAQLRGKVEELTQTTRRLTETQAQLVRSERMASVGRLAAGVAHEIGNPIAALMGMQELLVDGDLPVETQKDFLQRMKKETERIHLVVRDLLDFARPEQPASKGSPPEANVGEVFDDVVALVRPQKDFRAIQVSVDLPEPITVAMQPSRLTQVILNIVLNAGAALTRSLSPDRTDWRVTLRARKVGDRARIEIEDTGPGVPADLREKIFEPFFTTREVGDGTGLGLAVCRGLVEAARGEIGVDPDYRKGARFYVTLPTR